MLFQPNLLNALLAHDIAGREEDLNEATSASERIGSGGIATVYSRGYGLCQDRSLRKLELIPSTRYAISRKYGGRGLDSEEEFKNTISALRPS